MGIKEWAEQRYAARTDTTLQELRAQAVEYLAPFEAMDPAELERSINEHREWLHDRLRELGAPDDVFNALAQYEFVTYSLGVRIGSVLES